MMDVMMPTGMTIGLNKDLDIKSQINKNKAPSTREAINNKRVSLPINILTTCGIISPTKAIIPKKDTIQAVNKEV